MSTENKDFRVKNGLSVAGGGTFGAPVTIGEPVNADHAATKNYVDSIPQIPGPQGPAGSYIASETPPESPENNTAWFDTTTGAMFMFYDGFWIETTGSIGPTGPTGPAGTISTEFPLAYDQQSGSLSIDLSIKADSFDPDITVNQSIDSNVSVYVQSIDTIKRDISLVFNKPVSLKRWQDFTFRYTSASTIESVIDTLDLYVLSITSGSSNQASSIVARYSSGDAATVEAWAQEHPQTSPDEQVDILVPWVDPITISSENLYTLNGIKANIQKQLDDKLKKYNAEIVNPTIKIDKEILLSYRQGGVKIDFDQPGYVTIPGGSQQPYVTLTITPHGYGANFPVGMDFKFENTGMLYADSSDYSGATLVVAEIISDTADGYSFKAYANGGSLSALKNLVPNPPQDWTNYSFYLPTYSEETPWTIETETVAVEIKPKTIGYLDGLSSNVQDQIDNKLSSNSPSISNPTLSINSSYNSLVTDYLMSYFISASGSNRTMSFGSWTVMLNSTSLVAGDKVLLFSNSGVASTSEPVTVVSFDLNNSQVVLTSTNPAVLTELEAQNIVGGQAYKVIDQSLSITPQNLLRLSNLLNAPKIPANNSTLSVGRYFVPSSIDPFTLTLPASPELGDEIQIFDSGNYAGTQNITINRNGNKINGVADNALLDVNGVVATFVYTGSTYGWRMG